MMRTHSAAQKGAALWAYLRAQQTTSGFAAFSTAVLPMRATGEMPPGHLNSDLSPTACHIGLGRRRDLTFRQDVCLWKGDTKLSLAEVFKGQNVILVGFPGGPVCTEKHIPGYVAMADVLKQKGVSKVVCVTQNDPAACEKLAQQPKLQSPLVELLADRNGGFIRLMGLELGEAAASGPKCQRFAAIVESGVLLKLKVEKSPADLKTTDAKSMLELWDQVYGHLQN